MNVSDWIQLLVGIITGCSALISIYISVKTLKQNSQMIEDNTRPNIIIYKDVIDINSPMEYLVIKNIGNSLAHIISITFDNNKLDKLNKTYSQIPNALEKLSNGNLAPQQVFKIPIKTANIDFDEINFEIFYCSNVKNYREIFTINAKQDHGIKFTKQHIQNNDLRVISNALQELIKRIT